MGGGLLFNHNARDNVVGHILIPMHSYIFFLKELTNFDKFDFFNICIIGTVNHISIPSAFNSVPAFTYFKSSENVTNFYDVIPKSLHHFLYIRIYYFYLSIESL